MAKLPQDINKDHAVLNHVFEDLSPHADFAFSNGLGSMMQGILHMTGPALPILLVGIMRSPMMRVRQQPWPPPTGLAPVIGSTELRPIPWPSFSYHPIGLATLSTLESIAMISGRFVQQTSATFKTIYSFSVLTLVDCSSNHGPKCLSGCLFLHYGNSWNSVVHDGQGHILVAILSSIFTEGVGSLSCVLKFRCVPTMIVFVLANMVAMSMIVQLKPWTPPKFASGLIMYPQWQSYSYHCVLLHSQLTSIFLSRAASWFDVWAAVQGAKISIGK